MRGYVWRNMSERSFSRSDFARGVTGVLCGKKKLRGALAASALLLCTSGVGVLCAYRIDVIRAQLAHSEILESLLSDHGGAMPDLADAPRELSLLAGYLQQMAHAAERLQILPYRQMEIYAVLTRSAKQAGVQIKEFHFYESEGRLELTCQGGDGAAYTRVLAESGYFDEIVNDFNLSDEQFTIRCDIPPEDS